MRHRLAVAGLEGAIPFDAAALRHIHRHSRGVPRRINLLCDRALLAAMPMGRPHRQRHRRPGGPRGVRGSAPSVGATDPRPVDAAGRRPGAGRRGDRLDGLAAGRDASPRRLALAGARRRPLHCHRPRRRRRRLGAPLAAGPTPAMVAPAPAASDTAGTQATHAGAATSTSAASRSHGGGEPIGLPPAGERTGDATTSGHLEHCDADPGVSALAAQASAATARWLDEASWHDWLARGPVTRRWRRELAGSPAGPHGRHQPVGPHGRRPLCRAAGTGGACACADGIAGRRELGGHLAVVVDNGPGDPRGADGAVVRQAARLRSGGDDDGAAHAAGPGLGDDYALLWQPPAEAVVDGAGRVVSIDVGWFTPAPGCRLWRCRHRPHRPPRWPRSGCRSRRSSGPAARPPMARWAR